MENKYILDKNRKCVGFFQDGKFIEIIYFKGEPKGYFDGERYFMLSDFSNPGGTWEVFVLDHEEVEDCECPGRRLGHHFCWHMQAVDNFLYEKRHSLEEKELCPA